MKTYNSNNSKSNIDVVLNSHNAHHDGQFCAKELCRGFCVSDWRHGNILPFSEKESDVGI